VYQPPAPPRPAESLWELADLYASALAEGTADATVMERVLYGAVTEYDRDHEALAEALAPLARRYPPSGLDPWDQREVGGALRCLLHALLGRDLRAVLVMEELYGGRPQRAAEPEWAALYRIYELVEHLGRARVPCLLSTPTQADGTLDAEVLRYRLEWYERARAEPLPCDLEQALLRVRVEDAQEVLAGSALLGTAAGKELAALFAGPQGALPAFQGFVLRRADPPPDGAGADDASAQPVDTETGDRAPERPTRGAPPRARLAWIAPRFTPAHEAASADDRTPSPISILMNPPDPADADRFSHGRPNAHTALWPSMLPFDPDIVAAHATPLLYQQANDIARDRNTLLPELARTAGRPGPVTHLALAYGMAAGRTENRAAAVDTLVTLASRQLLDARTLGSLCGELWTGRMLKPNRILLSLDAAAQAGASREVFAACAAALPALSAQPSVRGLADLLVLAAECARMAGLRGSLPQLVALAALERPERVAAEARRLGRILGEG
jgi:hypothetical protein